MSVFKTVVFLLYKHLSSFMSLKNMADRKYSSCTKQLKSEFINVELLTSGGVNVTALTNSCLFFSLKCPA